MHVMALSQDIEGRNDSYYVAGTRISLDSVAYAVRRGETTDEILAEFPAIESRQKLERAIAFIRAHPKEIESYLAQNAQRWEEARKLNPPDLVERTRKHRAERASSPLEAALCCGRRSPLRYRSWASEAGARGLIRGSMEDPDVL